MYMKKLFNFLILPMAMILGSWTINPSISNVSAMEFGVQSPSDLLNMTMSGENDTILLRVAFLGDAEPKPLAEFPNMSAAVDQINELGKTQHIDFVVGVGDIAHKGTELQYEAATPVLQKLNAPFYPIMGNEEHGSTVERFLYYANKWNNKIDSARYVLEYDQIAFVFASPDFSREFDNNGARWILEQIQRVAPKPVVLIVHGAQKGVYPENRKKGIGNRMFRKKVIAQPNLAAVISGDLHMDMDRTEHSKKIKNVQYLHIPALERTKIPDETRHIPMFRVMTITKGGKVTVDTYAVGDTNPKKEHAYSFSIPHK
jgi:3',5'-cyclic-AMP phosphodiesterase